MHKYLNIKRLRNISFLFLFAGLASSAAGQKVDKVINNGIYLSYYSYDVQNPLYVTYTLKNGGGPCDRSKEGFSFKKCGERSASSSDYTNSGYERGHLANAEDFAYDCSAEEATFCYYNCVPQTRVLNHGKWLAWEFKIREMSKNKAIFIIAGAIFGNRPIKPGSKVMVPEYCYKIVVEPGTQKILTCLLFRNDDSDEMQELSLTELKARLKYPLLAEKDLKLPN